MKRIASLRVAFFVAFFAALVVGSVSAASITIDDFSAPTSEQTLSATSGSATILTTKDSSILGGQRQVMLTVAGAPGAASQSGLLRGVDPDSLWGGGSLNWGSTTGPGTTVNLLYAGPNNAGLGDIDLTGGGTNSGFDLSFGTITAGPNPTDGNNDSMHFQIIAYEGTKAATFDGNITQTIGTDASGIGFLVRFVEFSNPGISFSNIDALSISFGLLAQPGVSFELQSIQTIAMLPPGVPDPTPGVHSVPEPSSMVMAAMALVAFVRRRANRA